MKFIIIILLFNLVLAQDIGQKMFDNGDSDSAILFYKRLLNNEDISNDDLIYNLASIYSSLDSLDKAEEYFSLAESDSLNPSSELKYNYGNMLYKSKNLEGSLIAFKEALIKNPKDNDARKNYEFVKNEIDKTKQEKQKSQEQNEEKDDSQDKNNNNNEDQNKNNKNKDDKSNNSEEDPKKSNNNEGPTNQESSDTQQKDNDQDKEISVDQRAENILNAMKEAEKVNKKRKQTNYSNQSGKEW